MNLTPFLIAFVGGIILLLVEVVGDRLLLDDLGKLALIIIISGLVAISTLIIGVGGLWLLVKTIVNLMVFFTLLFFPVLLYSMLKK